MVAWFVAMDVVVAAEMFVELRFVYVFAAHWLHEAWNVLHDGPGVDPRIAFRPIDVWVGSRAIGLSSKDTGVC
jgi:hypothetical protein